MLSLFDPATEKTTGETAEFGNIQIHAFAPELETAVSWENGTHLLGSDLEENSDNLQLTLFWQAEHALEDSYKVFVHFQNEETGVIAAQSDSIPRNWTYPTNEWQPGEIVRDVISIPLSGLENGPFKVIVGLYDVQTGVPLPITSADENGLSDAYELTTWDR
jgi:hypothetical protein